MNTREGIIQLEKKTIYLDQNFALYQFQTFKGPGIMSPLKYDSINKLPLISNIMTGEAI